MTVMFALGALALVVGTGCFIWLTIVAFRESTGWGLATFLLPFAFIFFAIKHWDVAKRPFLSYIGTSAAGLMLLIASGVMAGMQASSMLEQEMLAAMEEAATEEWEVTTDEPAAMEASIEAPAAEAPAATERTPLIVDATLNVEEERPSLLKPRQRTKVGKIQPARADRYVGERMRVIGSRGLETTGRLISAKGDRLIFEKELPGGLASFEVSRREIDELVVLRR